MKLRLSIARFDVIYQLRQPSFYLFALLIFGQGIWYTDQVTTLYTYTEPALTTYLTLASLGVVLAIAAVLLAGESLRISGHPLPMAGSIRKQIRRFDRLLNAR